MTKPEGMHASPRCGARTRRGTACQAPAVRDCKRCRMHGGADGSGAPKGNQNALKNGRFTRKAIEDRRMIRALIKEANAHINDIEDSW
jgi:hypothetical protein